LANQSVRNAVGVVGQQTYPYDPTTPPTTAGSVLVNGNSQAYTIDPVGGTITVTDYTFTGGESIVIIGATASAPQAVVSNAIPQPFRNLIRNARFSINQRATASPYTLAANAYGHDGVKGGAAGATYTYALAANGIDTVITVTAGSIILPIESAMIAGGVYTVQNHGTSRARVWQGLGTTGSGSYVATPFTTPNMTANTQTNVEFGLGTVWLPQFELGSSATVFEWRPDWIEWPLCYRYLLRYLGNFINEKVPAAGIIVSTSSAIISVALPFPMRATPALIQSGVQLSDGTTTAAILNITIDVASPVSPSYNVVTLSSSFVVGRAGQLSATGATSSLLLMAELQ